MCLRHRSAPVVAICSRCGEALCDRCWRYLVGGRPWCETCVADRAAAGRSVWLVPASAFVFLALAIGYAQRRAPELDPIALAVGALFLLGLFVLRAVRKRRHAARWQDVEARSPGRTVANPLAPAEHPYRARLGRSLRRSAPLLSARYTALMGLSSLGATALLVPRSLHLPRWIEYEIVLALIWAIGGVTLATLLYLGVELVDDYRPQLDDPSGPRSDRPPAARRPSLGPLDGVDLGCVPDGCAGDGCLDTLLGVLISAAAVLAAWLFVDLVAPAVAFTSYWLVLHAVGRVTNRDHGCEGRLGAAAVRGFACATLYLLPLALLGTAVHAMYGYAR